MHLGHPVKQGLHTLFFVSFHYPSTHTTGSGIGVGIGVGTGVGTGVGVGGGGSLHVHYKSPVGGVNILGSIQLEALHITGQLGKHSDSVHLIKSKEDPSGQSLQAL